MENWSSCITSFCKQPFKLFSQDKNAIILSACKGWFCTYTIVRLSDRNRNSCIRVQMIFERSFMVFGKNREIKKLKFAVENCCGWGLTQKSQLSNSLRIFNGRGICVLLLNSCARQNVLYLTTICQRTLSNYVLNITCWWAKHTKTRVYPQKGYMLMIWSKTVGLNRVLWPLLWSRNHITIWTSVFKLVLDLKSIHLSYCLTILAGMELLSSVGCFQLEEDEKLVYISN